MIAEWNACYALQCETSVYNITQTSVLASAPFSGFFFIFSNISLKLHEEWHMIWGLLKGQDNYSSFEQKDRALLQKKSSSLPEHVC